MTSSRCGRPISFRAARDNNIQKFLGAPPMENRQLYFDASPISYATFANNKIGVLLVTGTEDDLVDRKRAHRAVPACAQAGRLLRAPVHRPRRAALLDERSDRRADQLFGLSGAAADALSGGEAVVPVARVERSENPGAECKPRCHPGFRFAQAGLRFYFFSSINVPSWRIRGWIASATFARSHGSTTSRFTCRRTHRWCRWRSARAH